MAKQPKIKIEYWPVERLRKYAKNAKLHPAEQVESISASIGEFGMIQPVLVDTTKGKDEIIAGHGRLDAIVKRGDAEVPVIPIGHLTPAQVKAYRVLDNEIAARGSWSPELLQAELAALVEANFPLVDVGFDEQWIKENLSIANAGDSPEDEEQPEPPKNPYVRPGDLWQLGEHRLFCGSSTDSEAVATVLGGAKPLLMVTDPPYGVEYDANFRNGIKRANGTIVTARAIGKVLNDDQADWREAWKLFKGDVAYVWCASLKIHVVAESLIDTGFDLRASIIWAKNQMAIGRGDYHWKHEPCWYAVRKGRKGHWTGDRSQTTVWDINKPSKSETGHSTQKPVECMRRPIENNSRRGDYVYEPFAGSFTTGIACETTGRKCLAIELNPAYVQIGVERWEKFTNRKAKLIGCYAGEAGLGKTAEDVRKARAGKRGKANAKSIDRESVRRTGRKPARKAGRPVAQQTVRAEGAA